MFRAARGLEALALGAGCKAEFYSLRKACCLCALPFGDSVHRSRSKVSCMSDQCTSRPGDGSRVLRADEPNILHRDLQCLACPREGQEWYKGMFLRYIAWTKYGHHY